MPPGGDYYDRDVYSAPTPSRSTTTSTSSTSYGGGGTTSGSVGYSSTSAQVFQNVTTLNTNVNPTRFATTNLSTNHTNPIVCAIDVTGSMGDWTKIIYDKLPMFYGQIMMQRYLTDPCLSFAAVGDCFADDAPLQVTNFGQGGQIDGMISKFWLEGGGGGGHKESYELSAYFYLHKCEFPSTALPFFFLTGDELFFPQLRASHVEEFMGVRPGSNIDSVQIFRRLRDKFKGNVFLLKKPYWNEKTDEKILQEWAQALGGTSHILEMKEAKSCVDVMLGAIAIVSKARTLDEYVKDMQDRDQSKERISEVRNALLELSCSITGEPYRGTYSGRKQVWVNFGALESSGGGVVDADEEDEDEDEDDEDEVVRMIQSEYKKMVMKHSEDFFSETSSRQTKEKLERVKDQRNDTFPKELLCPITMEVMVDPVITDDGHTYERLAIEEWLKNNETSPMTNKKLKSKQLRPNHALRKLINDLTK